MWLGVDKAKDKLSKERIGPTEPLPREDTHVVLRERLVHEASRGTCFLQDLQTTEDLIIAARGKRLHDQTHWPDLRESSVGAAHPRTGCTVEKIRVAAHG